MKVRRLICPGCNKEKILERTDEDNLQEYSEEQVTQHCPDCDKSAEARLITAIFGEEVGPSLWSKEKLR